MDSDSAVEYLEDDAFCVPERVSAHAVVLAPHSRVIADSHDLGWHDAYASLTARRAWTGRIAPLPHLGLGYCLRGVAPVVRHIDGEARPQQTDFAPRRLAILPTHAPAWFDVTGDADVLVVYLRGGMVRAVADRLFGASTRPLHFQPILTFSDPLLEQFCLTFAEALHRRQKDSARYIDQIAESAAAHCLVHYAQERRMPTPAATGFETALGRVSAFVDDHLEGDLSLEALAEAARLSPAALKRAVADTHGATPKQWVIRRRIAYAREMLADTNLPLAEIALQAGFASQSHLCTMFKREVGLTPGDFRRAN